MRRSLLVYAREKALAINVYRSKTNVNLQLLATRIYLMLLILSLVVVSIFTRFQLRTVQITFDSVSETYFELLHTHYSDTLSCPCSRITVAYDNVVTISSKFHEVCQQVVNGFDFSTLTIENPTLIYTDSSIIRARFLAVLDRCVYVEGGLEQIQDDICLTDLVTTDAIFQRVLKALIDGTIIRVSQSSLIESSHFYTSMVDMFQANQFQSQFMSTWKTEFSSSNESFVLRTKPVSLNNRTCFCAGGASNCTRPLFVHNSDGDQISFPSSPIKQLYETPTVFGNICS